MLELILLLVLAVPVAAFVARPLLTGRGRAPGADQPLVDDEREARELRHAIAIEALRDVEADHRAGRLDPAGYRRQRDAAEAHAARTLAELEAGAPRVGSSSATGSRQWALRLGVAIVALLVAGYLLPEPITIASRTVVNERLAAQLAAEEARQDRISDLAGRWTANPDDREALVALTDAYLEGNTLADLQAAARLLIYQISLDGADLDAHRKLATAYIRAGDYGQAAEVTERLAELSPESPDVPFLRGLIALRTDEPAGAVEHFDTFLEQAPDDARVPMVRDLRDEAAEAAAAPSG